MVVHGHNVMTRVTARTAVAYVLGGGADVTCLASGACGVYITFARNAGCRNALAGVACYDGAASAIVRTITDVLGAYSHGTGRTSRARFSGHNFRRCAACAVTGNFGFRDAA